MLRLPWPLQRWEEFVKEEKLAKANDKIALNIMEQQILGKKSTSFSQKNLDKSNKNCLHRETSSSSALAFEPWTPGERHGRVRLHAPHLGFAAELVSDGGGTLGTTGDRSEPSEALAWLRSIFFFLNIFFGVNFYFFYLVFLGYIYEH